MSDVIFRTNYTEEEMTSFLLKETRSVLDNYKKGLTALEKSRGTECAVGVGKRTEILIENYNNPVDRLIILEHVTYDILGV